MNNKHIGDWHATALYTTLANKKYVVNTRPWELNIIGIRSTEKKVNTFNDTIILMYNTDKSVEMNAFQCTTEPGLYWLQHPENKLGTAILKPGQYVNCYGIGLHRGEYEALVQIKPVTVYRDINRDDKFDFISGTEDIGIFGVNIHRANALRESIQVDKWSAGCTVLSSPRYFSKLMTLAHKHKELYGNQFTYTLINEEDYVNHG